MAPYADSHATVSFEIVQDSVSVASCLLLAAVGQLCILFARNATPPFLDYRVASSSKRSCPWQFLPLLKVTYFCEASSAMNTSVRPGNAFDVLNKDRVPVNADCHHVFDWFWRIPQGAIS